MSFFDRRRTWGKIGADAASNGTTATAATSNGAPVDVTASNGTTPKAATTNGDHHGGATRGAGGMGAPSTGPPGHPYTPSTRKRPWYRGGAVLIAGVVVLLVGVSVIADLPHHVSKTTQITTADTVIKSVNTGIHVCTYATSQAFSFYQQDTAGALTASDKAQLPGLMRDDEEACSFTDQSIVNLATITLPNTAAGRDLGQVITSVYEWTTSDAVGAMDDIQTLMTGPKSTSTRAGLAHDEQLLASDRLATDREMAAVNKALGGAHVADPALPRLPGPSAG